MTFTYPTPEQGLEAGKELVKIVLAKEVGERKAEVVKDAYVVLGAGADVLLGDPDGPHVIGAASSVPVTLEGKAENLKEILFPEEGTSEVQGPLVWKLLIDLALAAFERFVVR
jgi:hypothetical protein